MLTIYQQQNGGLKGTVIGDDDTLPPTGVLWIDMLNPTLEERHKVNLALGIDMPTRADMEEIEISSRLYQEDAGLFMTATVLTGMESDLPESGAITFVLARETLVTIRYIDPQPFRTMALRCERSAIGAHRAEAVLLQLLDVIIDRMADILERVGGEVENISREIFDPEHRMQGKDFQSILRRLGRKHDLAGKLRESLLTLSRMFAFLTQAFEDKAYKELKPHLKTLSRDALSLQDHTNFLSGKLSYLQDGTLGLINNEQNNIIKIMSVAAMVFLPPTLFASIWGMNFRHMPELDEVWGYPLAIVVMIISAFLPYLYFKRRGWL